MAYPQQFRMLTHWDFSDEAANSTAQQSNRQNRPGPNQWTDDASSKHLREADEEFAAFDSHCSASDYSETSAVWQTSVASWICAR